MKPAFSPPYSLATGEKDRKRLHILNSLYNEQSLAVLDLKPGMRVITVGCGIGLLEAQMAEKVGPDGLVLGTDADEKQLTIANEIQAPNLRFQKCEASQIQTIEGQFARVHCRFVLGHFSWDKLINIFDQMYTKVAPGGIFVIEEITTLASLCCEPTNEAYDAWKHVFFALVESQGLTMNPGEKLKEYLEEKKYSFAYSSHQPILRAEREKQILSMGVESCSKTLIDRGAMTREEIDMVIAKLRDLELDPNLYPCVPQLSQFAIKK